MPTTLSKGFYTFSKGEKGFWSFLNLNTQKVNDHTHNGSDSQHISFSNLSRVSQSLSSADWVTSGESTGYKQTVTLPSGFAYDTVNVIARLASTGQLIYPKIVKVSATQYDIYVNDNTLDLTVVYA